MKKVTRICYREIEQLVNFYIKSIKKNAYVVFEKSGLFFSYKHFNNLKMNHGYSSKPRLFQFSLVILLKI